MNKQEKIKHACEVVSTLFNGWELTVSYLDKTDDGDIDDLEFWATEDEIKTTHKAIEIVIKDFRVPVIGDTIDDGGDMFTVHEVWFQVKDNIKELHIGLK